MKKFIIVGVISLLAIFGLTKTSFATQVFKDKISAPSLNITGKITNSAKIKGAAQPVKIYDSLRVYGNSSFKKRATFDKTATFKGPAVFKNTVDLANATLLGVYASSEVDALLAGYYTQAQIDAALGNYYTSSEVNTLLASYYTSSETDILLADYYTQIQADALLSSKSDVGHSHAGDEWTGSGFLNPVLTLSTEVENGTAGEFYAPDGVALNITGGIKVVDGVDAYDDAVGHGTLSSGSTTVTISNSRVGENPAIFLTIGNASTQNTNGGIRVDSTSAGQFVVGTMDGNPASVNISFNYLIIE